MTVAWRTVSCRFCIFVTCLIDSAPMAPPSDLLSGWPYGLELLPGQSIYVTRLLTETASVALWKRFVLFRTKINSYVQTFFRHINAFSALGMWRRCTLQIDNLLTYLLTVFCTHLKSQRRTHFFSYLHYVVVEEDFRYTVRSVARELIPFMAFWAGEG